MPLPSDTSPAWDFDGVDDYLDLPRSLAPGVKGRAIEIRAVIAPARPNGVILAHGGERHGYALYLDDGRLALATCVDTRRTTLRADDRLPQGRVSVAATIGADGALALLVEDAIVAKGRSPGPLVAEPGDSLQIGADTISPVGPYEVNNHFGGVIDRILVTIAD